MLYESSLVEGDAAPEGDATPTPTIGRAWKRRVRPDLRTFTSFATFAKRLDLDVLDMRVRVHNHPT